MSSSAASARGAWLLTLVLGACGYDAPLGPPSPPPQPSRLLDQKAPGVVQRTGILSDLSVPTRSWLLTADGQRLTCHLAAAGTVSIDGHSAGLEELQPGVPVTIEGVQRADLVLVDRVTVGGAAEAAPADAAGTAAPDAAAGSTAPDVAPGAAAPTESPAAAPAAGTAAPAAPAAAPPGTAAPAAGPSGTAAPAAPTAAPR